MVDRLPDAAVESFAGVANPVSIQTLSTGARVVDAGSGGGFDCFVAAQQVGNEGFVIGVDMLCMLVSGSVLCSFPRVYWVTVLVFPF